jgi:hypothetical protein
MKGSGLNSQDPVVPVSTAFPCTPTAIPASHLVSYTTYVGGHLSGQFDHPFVPFEATRATGTNTMAGEKRIHFPLQTQLRHGDGK